jgi:hypothetical protein
LTVGCGLLTGNEVEPVSARDAPEQPPRGAGLTAMAY